MTFDLSPHHAAVRVSARAYAEQLQRRAVEIDRTGVIADDIRREVASLVADDGLTTVLAVEEIARASAAVATKAAATAGGDALGVSGLRGASTVEPSPRAQLVLAAVALGVGSAATEAALTELRRANASPGADVEKPHWVIADVATDLDAARLLTYKAARSASDGDIALARLSATAAATRAVDAAIRVMGPAALVEGGVIERLSRDVRALSVLSGTEEEVRAVAADALWPH